MTFLKTFLFLLIAPYTTFASTDTTHGWWIGTFAKKEINTRLNGWMETQVRNSFETGDVTQLLYRAGLLYSSSNSSRHGWGGLIAYIESNGSLERRLTFQHTFKYFNKPKSQLSHRMRLEGRDFANSTNDGLRLRYLIRYNYKAKATPLILWNESFIHLTSEFDRGHRQYERNRFFLGTSLPFGTTKLEVGYLNQSVFREQQNTTEHLAVLYWFF